MATIERVKQVYEVQEDGTSKLVSTTTIEVEVPTEEEIIADKEAQLLAMYKELEALKSVNSES